jgi:hypothetical protein
MHPEWGSDKCASFLGLHSNLPRCHFQFCGLVKSPCGVVIPNEVRDLHFAASCRSLTSFGMTIHGEVLQIPHFIRDDNRWEADDLLNFEELSPYSSIFYL